VSHSWKNTKFGIFWGVWHPYLFLGDFPVFFSPFFFCFSPKKTDFYKKIYEISLKHINFHQQLWVANSGWATFWQSVADNGFSIYTFEIIVTRDSLISLDSGNMQTIGCVHDFCSFSRCFMQFCGQSQHVTPRSV
jgi:hypothetical protein